MIEERLFKCICDQLIYHVDGTMDKFNETFRKACELCSLEVDSGYMSYIYFDFLNLIGVIEKYRRGAGYRWRVNEFSGKPVSDVSVLFYSNYKFSLFPGSSSLNNYFYEISDWKSLLERKRLSLENVIKYSIRGANPDTIESRYTKKFSFDVFNWQSQDFTLGDYGIYLVGYHDFQKEPLVYIDKMCFYVHDYDYLFLLFFIVTNDFKLFETEGDTLLIPWKIKLPALIKRYLLSVSSSIHYDYEGVKFKIEDTESLKSLINSLGDIQVFVGESNESR